MSPSWTVTVAQVCFREQWDREMAKVQDGFKPLASWEEKIASTMRICKQNKHLTQGSLPICPVCQLLSKRLFSAGGALALLRRPWLSLRDHQRKGSQPWSWGRTRR